MYKEFDLEKALAGEPLITRDGQPVTEFHFFKTARPDCSYPIVAVVDGSIKGYNRKGEWDNGRHKHSYDLFMALAKKQEWVNVYKSGGSSGYSLGRSVFSTREDALNYKYGSEYVTTILIREWEE